MSQKNDLAKEKYGKPFSKLYKDRKRIIETMIKLEKLERKEKFLSVPKASFNFCRYTVAILVWIAFIFNQKWPLIIVFVLMAISVVFTVRWAPLIVFYSNTVGSFIKSEDELLSIGSTRFAHSLCLFLTALCLMVLYLGNAQIGWIFVGAFAILKTISAVGLCPASKLYSCATSKGGSCCSFLRKND